MSASPTIASAGWTPVSPVEPRPDPEHEAHLAAAIARAHREIPYYQAKRPAPHTAAAPWPLLTKGDVRGTLPKQWVAPGRDLKADLASGAIELVETSGSTGERLRILWDEGWWPRQESRGMKTHPRIAAAMGGAHGKYREAILTTPECGLGTCHVGDLPYAERSDDTHLWVNQRPDPLFWTDEEKTRILDELAHHETVGLESDPFYLALLSRFARARGRTVDVRSFVQLTYAFTTRAALRTIREAYQGDVLQLYGASEVGVLFMEGEDGLLHHCPFTSHVELLPAKVPTPGAENVAMVVVTTMDRFAMPLVRFVVGDVVQVAPDGPRRWTSVAPLRTVEGRLDDALVLPGGGLVTAGAIDRAIDVPEGLVSWQVNQRTPTTVEVDVVAEGDAARTVGVVRDRLAPLLAGLELTARSVTAVPLEASGKFRVSKRHFPIDLTRSFEGA